MAGRRRCDRFNGFAFTEGRHLVENFGHHLANVIFMIAHRPRSEPAGNQAALRLMVRIVQVDHGLIRGLVEVGARATEGGVPGAITLDGHDVVVARDRPKLLDRIPVHRRFLTKPPEGLPRVDVELWIEHVDTWRGSKSSSSEVATRLGRTQRSARTRATPRR